jgi:inosine-uridine nucleoside N-ribohydrolase
VKKHIIIDTDIGFDPDDFVALLLILANKKVKVDLIVTNQEIGGQRAAFIRRVLRCSNKTHIPVVKGKETNNPYFLMSNMVKKQPEKKRDYSNQINEVLNRNNHTYYLCLGALTNIAEYLKNYDLNPNLTLIQMGGSERREEHNFSMDYESARYVFSQEIDAKLVTSEITNNREILITSETKLHELIRNSNLDMLQLLYKNIHRFKSPFYLHDPLTSTAVINDAFLEYKPGEVRFYDNHINKYEFNKEGKVQIAVGADYSNFMKYVCKQFQNIINCGGFD